MDAPGRLMAHLVPVDFWNLSAIAFETRFGLLWETGAPERASASTLGLLWTPIWVLLGWKTASCSRSGARAAQERYQTKIFASHLRKCDLNYRKKCSLRLLARPSFQIFQIWFEGHHWSRFNSEKRNYHDKLSYRFYSACFHADGSQVMAALASIFEICPFLKIQVFEFKFFK